MTESSVSQPCVPVCQTGDTDAAGGSARLLSAVFAAGGLWDTVAGVMYLFFIGTGRWISDPPIHPFYAVFLGSFFLCFAYLEFLSARNIRRYAVNVGCLIFGRVFYVAVLLGFMHGVEGFPSTFAFTAVIDGFFAAAYPVSALIGGMRLRDLFIPAP